MQWHLEDSSAIGMSCLRPSDWEGKLESSNVEMVLLEYGGDIVARRV